MRDRSTRPVLAALAVMVVALGCQAGAGGTAGTPAGSSTPPPAAPSATARPDTKRARAHPGRDGVATGAVAGGRPAFRHARGRRRRSRGGPARELCLAGRRIGQPVAARGPDRRGRGRAADRDRRRRRARGRLDGPPRAGRDNANGVGAIALGAGSGAVAFAAPDAGSWSIQVDIQFGDDLGSAAYYWRLDVR